MNDVYFVKYFFNSFRRFFLSFISIAFFSSLLFSSCASKNPLVKTWHANYSKGGKEMEMRSVFTRRNYKSYLSIDGGAEQKLLKGYYKATENVITFTITHEFDEQSRKLKKLKKTKTFSNTYDIDGDKLIMGK